MVRKIEKKYLKKKARRRNLKSEEASEAKPKARRRPPPLPQPGYGPAVNSRTTPTGERPAKLLYQFVNSIAIPVVLLYGCSCVIIAHKMAMYIIVTCAHNAHLNV